ncbi:MAG: dTMP kinase [Alistipes sp.]|nr:dTMP kinase [Alistipes sp.]
MFIVLEGVDGCGKSTQIAKLRAMFAEQGVESEYLHFPRFDAPYFGDMIARFLRGELGSIEQVDPYVVALLYAEDRRDAAPMIQGWLNEGKVVIVDRYVYSNVGYQCAKLQDEADREKLRQWILNLEYDYFAIPKPDVSLFLDVPFAFTERKLTEQRVGDDRDYLQGKQDIHEQSMDLQRAVRQVYIDASGYDDDMHVVDCTTATGEMASPDEIFGRIMQVVESYVKFSK